MGVSCSSPAAVAAAFAVELHDYRMISEANICQAPFRLSNSFMSHMMVLVPSTTLTGTIHCLLHSTQHRYFLEHSLIPCLNLTEKLREPVYHLFQNTAIRAHLRPAEPTGNKRRTLQDRRSFQPARVAARRAQAPTLAPTLRIWLPHTITGNEATLLPTRNPTSERHFLAQCAARSGRSVESSSQRNVSKFTSCGRLELARNAGGLK